MIEVSHLKKTFGALTVLKDVNAVIEKGEVISIIGPSGTGKSTFLRCLNLLERPTEGKILFNGIDLLDPRTDISRIRMKIGMVFQQFNLFPQMTVLENITMSPIKLLKQTRQQAEARAMELLRMVGLESRAYALPSELSGGQQQRVAIARTLAMDPEVILFDEPTSALDPTMKEEVQTVIAQLAKTEITMLIVTHEMEFARNISTRVFYMDEGIIYEDSPADTVFWMPRNIRTAMFIHRVEMESIQVARGEYALARIRRRRAHFEMFMKLSAEEGERYVQTLIFVLQKVFFPLVAEVEVRTGVNRYTNCPAFSILWKGKGENPIQDESEIGKQLHAMTKNIQFYADQLGRCRLLFDVGR